MPYNKQESRKAVAEKGLDEVREFGDLNYFITTIILKMWNSNPCYATAHIIRKELVQEPKSSKLLSMLKSELADRFTMGDIYNAAALAWDEFSNRVLRLYEAIKCRENGDVEGYPEALQPLLEKLQGNLKKQQAAQLIIPGGK